MRASLSLGLLMALAVGTLSGCGATKNLAGDPSNSQDVADVSSAVSSQPAIVDDGLFESTDESGAFARTGRAGASVEGAAALIHPLRYWRTITSVDRRFEFAFSDSDSTGRPRLALVTIHKRMRGTFNILVGDSMPRDGNREHMQIVHKPLEDEWTRRVLVRRVRIERPDSGEVHHEPRFEWSVVAASGAAVRSPASGDLAPTRILSVRVQGADFDTTITDPLALLWREHLPAFNPGGEVHLTVTTQHPDDVVVLMCMDRRVVLRPNGDNTYSGAWEVTTHDGVRHFGVNALSHGTLFDDSAAYASHGWLWPYEMRGAHNP